MIKLIYNLSNIQILESFNFVNFYILSKNINKNFHTLNFYLNFQEI